MGQWQHANDVSSLFRIQKIAVMTEALFHHRLPAGTVKKGRFRTGLHEVVPTDMVVLLQPAHVECAGGVGGSVGGNRHIHYRLSRKMQSMRSQRKSPASRVSLASIRCRFR